MIYNNKQYYVYLICNKNNTTIYTGITSDLKRRIWEHKNKTTKGFSSKYNLYKLLYYEIYQDPENAIIREKQIKSGSREKKIELIESMNPKWIDLYDNL
jgi:putative endonuclease